MKITHRQTALWARRISAFVLCILLAVPAGLAFMNSEAPEEPDDDTAITETLDDIDEEVLNEEVDEPNSEDETEELDNDDEMDEPDEEEPAPTRASISRAYYLSNEGDDMDDGETPETAWASLDMLNNTVFSPGDVIYLDAQSVWEGQLTLHGSGEDGNPIVLTKYNSDDPSIRPIINGGGTTSYERRWSLGIGPDNITSGALELIDVSYWEVSGLEITNLGEDLAQRRCGIRILSDYAISPESRTMGNYEQNKMEHIYIRDCYIHDVNSASPSQQAPGFDGAPVAGAKSGGGIISSGFVDDLLVEGNTVVRCDSEGIRSEACGPTDGANGYPQAAKITFKNNYISQCAGDGVVMSGANGGVMEYNYITLCGKSYLTDVIPQRLNTQSFSAMWFIGCANSVAQYNVAINNSYESANGGSAWGIDGYCDNVVFQYNYSAGNPGGWLFFKYASANTAIRYNISVNDGSSPGYNKSHDSFISLDPLGSANEDDAPRIYNNLLILNLKESTAFFGRNGDAHVFLKNNIVYSKNQNFMNFLAGQGDITYRATGDIANNLFYPAGLFDLSSDFSSPEAVYDNLFLDPLLENIEAVPMDVLRNSDGSNIDSIGLRDMIFDASILNAFKLTENSPAKGAGAPVTVNSAMDQWFPLTEDIFGNPIENDLNIGVEQSVDVIGYYLEFAPGQTPTMVIRKNMSAQIKINTNCTSLIYVSNNSSIVSVDANGTITGKGVGVAVILIKDADSGLSLQVVVNCQI